MSAPQRISAQEVRSQLQSGGQVLLGCDSESEQGTIQTTERANFAKFARNCFSRIRSKSRSQARHPFEHRANPCEYRP
jgi:hypothetical protein